MVVVEVRGVTITVPPLPPPLSASWALMTGVVLEPSFPQCQAQPVQMVPKTGVRVDMNASCLQLPLSFGLEGLMRERLFAIMPRFLADTVSAVSLGEG